MAVGLGGKTSVIIFHALGLQLRITTLGSCGPIDGTQNSANVRKALGQRRFVLRPLVFVLMCRVFNFSPSSNGVAAQQPKERAWQASYHRLRSSVPAVHPTDVAGHNCRLSLSPNFLFLAPKAKVAIDKENNHCFLASISILPAKLRSDGCPACPCHF